MTWPVFWTRFQVPAILESHHIGLQINRIADEWITSSEVVQVPVNESEVESCWVANEDWFSRQARQREKASGF